MEVISLNTWGGRAGKEKLLAFFKAHRDTDVFCLQEVWSAPYEHLEGSPAGGMSIAHDHIMVYGMQEIAATLSGHKAYFRPHHLENYGLMMLVKEDLDVVTEGDVFVHKERGHIPKGDAGLHARNVQYVTIATAKGKRTVMNFHGLWNVSGKGDSEDRLLQSDRIVTFMKSIPNPFLICGDFNLLPDTESLKKFETFGLRNLIKEYGVTSTRTSYYTKEQKFADYALVSEGVEVQDFQVLSDEVSDHAPLLIRVT